MKAAIIFNTHALGGAERSMICQLDLMGQWEIECFIPEASESNENDVKEQLSNRFNIHHFKIPTSFTNLSRSGQKNVFELLRGGLALIWHLLTSKVFRFSEYDLIYCNGLKVMILSLMHSIFVSSRKCYVFHFRDYLESAIVIRLLSLICPLRGHQFIYVANSESVAGSLRERLPEFKDSVKVVYNLATRDRSKALSKEDKPQKRISHIALASMMAPWKGIHWAIVSMALMKDELFSLGIKAVNIYGDEIYQTVGDHRGYLAECKALVSKLGAQDLFCFKGMRSPAEIFEANDVLIHSSIAPEPFGRVVLEAFHHRVLLISTGLGGSGELVEAGENAMKVYPYDTLGLLGVLRKISQGVSFRTKLLNNGYRYSDMLNRKSIEQVKELISECEKGNEGLVANRH